MKKPTKPSIPTKPTEPPKTRIVTSVVGRQELNSGRQLTDILDKLCYQSELPLESVICNSSVEVEYSYCGDGGSDYFLIVEDHEEVENENYSKELKEYNKKLSKYNQKLLEYDKKLEQYSRDIIAYGEWVKQEKPDARAKAIKDAQELLRKEGLI